MFACHKIVHIRWPTETFAQARVDVKPMSISFTCIPSRNKAWIAAASSARLKFSAFRQLIMERWCGVFIENLQHCQKAGTFRSFEERSGSDAFILYLPLLQECLNFVCPTITFLIFVCLNLVCLNLVWLKGELEAPPNEDLGCITSRAQRTVATCFTRFLEN